MAAHLTRLGTRTKEFNMHASCWVFSKPASVVKASRGSVANWRDPVRWRRKNCHGGRNAGPSLAHVAVVEFERAR
jgi:hypothetical protein